jgi:hypothetical protein
MDDSKNGDDSMRVESKELKLQRKEYDAENGE